MKRSREAAAASGRGNSRDAAEEAQKDKNAGRSLKNQIRGVQRLLKRDLDASARQVQEAKLASLLQQQQERQHGQQERKMALRYRRVCL